MNNNTKSPQEYMCVYVVHIYTCIEYIHTHICIYELREMRRVGGKKERGGNNANMKIIYEIIKNSLRLEPLSGN